MFASSSKRALISTSTTTCLPCSAARIRSRTIGESPEVRYNVILMVSTSGSSAACAMNRSIDAPNDSYGWWTRMSPCRIAAKTSTASPSSCGVRRAGTTGVQGGSRSSGRSSVASCQKQVASRIPGTAYASSGPRPMPPRMNSRTLSGMPSSTSRRTAEPKRRWRSSCSIADTRSPASSSSMSKSASRVTRNGCDSTISRPGKRTSRFAAITCSSGT